MEKVGQGWVRGKKKKKGRKKEIIEKVPLEIQAQGLLKMFL